MFSGTNLPKVGTYNVNVVLSAIQASEDISRVEIAQRTGLTAQTVSVIVRRLLEQGIIQESGPLPSAGGKPRTALRVNPSAAYAVGIHFDPLEVSIVVVDMLGRELSRSRNEIPAGREPEVLIAEAAKVAQELLHELDVPIERVLGVGAACPGPIDQDEGQVISLPRNDHWTDVPIKHLLQECTGLDVIVDNDANAAAIGERWSGHGRDCSDFAFLYLGTGIGGAMFLSNHIYRGVSLNAGELGHVVVEPNGAPCYCGGRGCLEAMCTTASIVRDVRAELALGRASSLTALYKANPELVDHTAVCLAAAAHDGVARRVIDRAADYIADCAVMIANVLDVELIVLGGKGVIHVADIYLQRVCEALQTRPLARRVHTVRAAISAMASSGAALGAATLVLHTAFAPDTASLTSFDV
ncbi:MAG TPA: ROK family transcriptional regulator [Acidimicrobiales bacterium]|nr:ROK family transcriptional regulator [Acidimicrobiales bacterium]